MELPKQGENFSYFGNAIAENVRKKKRNRIVAMVLPKQMKFVFLVIVAMALPKMGGEKKIVVAEIWEEILKKCYIHNIFIILSQQIIGDQLLLVQI